MVIVPVLTVTGSTLNSKLAAVRSAAWTPRTVMVEPALVVMTALPFASSAMVRSIAHRCRAEGATAPGLPLGS
jgi:hypothetical protein